MTYPLLVFDSTLNFIGELEDYEYFGYTSRWRSADEFTLRINRNKNLTSYLINGNFIAVRIYDELTGENKYRMGKIGYSGLSLGEEGKISETLELKGNGLDGILSQRIALYNTRVGDGYDSQSGAAETLMKHYVDCNAVNAKDQNGSNAPNRVIDLIVIEADSERGALTKYSARFQELSLILEEISKAVDDIGWGLAIDLNSSSENYKKFVFTVYQGIDRSTSQSVNSWVVFKPDFDNTKLLNFVSDEINSKNHAYVAGQGEAQARDIQEVYVDSLEPVGIDRREILIDARNISSSDDYIERGKSRLGELAKTDAFEVENIQQGPFIFERDFKMGDIITVSYPDIITIHSRVIEVIEEFTTDLGRSISITIGKEIPDLKSVIIERTSNMNNEIRR